MATGTSLLASPIARLGAYALVLVASLGGGAVIGATLGPEPSTPATPDDHPTAVTVAVPEPSGAASTSTDAVADHEVHGG